MSLMKTKLDNYSADQAPAQNELEVTFNVTAFSDPSTLPRILENFALRNLVPRRLQSEARADKLHLSITVFPLRTNEAKHLQLRMHNILHVLSVEMEFKS